MKPSGIGGQAVIEGVMMKNKNEYAIAVRKPDHEIIIKKDTHHGILEKYNVFKLPILRGIIAFIESLQVGMKTITYSASFFEDEEAQPSKLEQAISKIFKGKAESVITGLTVCMSVIIALGIFVVLPTYLSHLLSGVISSDILLAVMEGLIRIFIFIGYVGLISKMEDIKRVFMYHGAEHKTINCIERGYELTIDNVRMQSKEHKRCGTSFLLYVMVISILFFVFVRIDTLWLKTVVRLLLVPVIAGVSYEFIKFAGRSDSAIMNILSKPGLWLQGLTTKEPDDEMIEVAIASVDAVFDWRSFLKEHKIDNTMYKEVNEANGKNI